MITRAVTMNDVHALSAQSHRSLEDRAIESQTAHFCGHVRNAGFLRAIRQSRTWMGYETGIVPASAQLGDDKKRPIDLARPGSLAVDMNDVHWLALVKKQPKCPPAG
jgi:hypothetical protein